MYGLRKRPINSRGRGGGGEGEGRAPGKGVEEEEEVGREAGQVERKGIEVSSEMVVMTVTRKLSDCQVDVTRIYFEWAMGE